MAYPSFIEKAEELINSHIQDVSCECKDEYVIRKEAILLALKTVKNIKSVNPNLPLKSGYYRLDETLRYWNFVEKELHKKLEE